MARARVRRRFLHIVDETRSVEALTAHVDRPAAVGAAGNHAGNIGFSDRQSVKVDMSDPRVDVAARQRHVHTRIEAAATYA